MSINSRVKKIIEHFELNPNSFSVRTGITAPAVHHIIGERQSKPGADVIGKIIKAFPTVNSEWLLTGKGDMILPEQSSASKAVAYPVRGKGIPLFPDYASAGKLNGFMDKLSDDIPMYYVPGFEDCDLMVPVAGDSMYDDYSPGDIIICKHINHPTFIQWGHAHLVDTVQGLLVKYLYPSEKKDFIKFVSKNENYPPFEMHRTKDAKRYFIVKGKLEKKLI